ncbi:MAG: histidine phosphotransferase family protein [Rickettsiales bacterium]
MAHPTMMAEMLATKLCHDLTGPIGAVNNGAEFISDEDFSMQGDALQLITDSAREASVRLQFYRQSYGSIKGAGEVSLAEKKQLVSGFFKNSRIQVDWPDLYADAGNVSLAQRTSRLMLNMIIIVAGTMIKGGTLHIRIEQDGDADKVITIKAEADVLKVDPEVLKILDRSSDAPEMSPKNVQVYFTANLVNELTVTLSHAHQDGTFSLIARKSAA